jgi:hypothetical protein
MHSIIDQEIGTRAKINNDGPRPIEELFDILVSKMEDIGILIDIGSAKTPRLHLLADGVTFNGSAECEAAFRRGITRLLNGRRGDGRLRWGSERITMYTQPTPAGPKEVCCIGARIPVTTDAKCECGRKDYKCTEHAKYLQVTFMFHMLDIPRERRIATSTIKGCDGLTLDRVLDAEDRMAWNQARWKGDRYPWRHWPDTSIDLRSLWNDITWKFVMAAKNSPGTAPWSKGSIV